MALKQIQMMNQKTEFRFWKRISWHYRISAEGVVQEIKDGTWHIIEPEGGKLIINNKRCFVKSLVKKHWKKEKAE